MRGFSKAIIAGNLTRDPEMRTTPAGANVCTFTVAVNRSFRDTSGNQREEVSYIDCNAWGKLGETISKFMHRGRPILLSGRLQQHSWDDKNTGTKRSRTEIVVEDFTFIGGDRNGDAGSSYGGSYGDSSSSASSNAASSQGKTDTIPTDIPDGEINLDEIAFDVPADGEGAVSPEDIPF